MISPMANLEPEFCEKCGARFELDDEVVMVAETVNVSSRSETFGQTLPSRSPVGPDRPAERGGIASSGPEPRARQLSCRP